MSINLTNSTTLKTMQLICNTNLYFDLHIAKRNNFLLETLLYSSPYKVPFELKLLNNVNDESQGIFGFGGNLSLCYELEKTNDNSIVLIHPTKEREIFERWIDDTPTTDPVSFKETVFIYYNEEKSKAIILNKSFENVEAPEDLDYELFLGGTRVKFPLFQDNQNLVKCNKIIVKDSLNIDKEIDIEYQNGKINSITTNNKLKDRVLFYYDTNSSLCNQIKVFKQKEKNNPEEYFIEETIKLQYSGGRVTEVTYHYHDKTSYQGKVSFSYLENSLNIKDEISGDTVVLSLLGNQYLKYVVGLSNEYNNFMVSYEAKKTKIASDDVEEEYHFDNAGNIDFVRNNGKIKFYQFDSNKKPISVSDWLYEDGALNKLVTSSYYKKTHLNHNLSILTDDTCPSSGNTLYLEKPNSGFVVGGTELSLFYDVEGAKNDVLNVHIWSKIILKNSATNNAPITIKVDLLDENENVLEKLVSSEGMIELSNTMWTFNLIGVQAKKHFKKVKVKFTSMDIVDRFEVNVSILNESLLTLYKYDNEGKMIELFDGTKTINLTNLSDIKTYSSKRYSKNLKSIYEVDASGFIKETYLDDEDNVSKVATRHLFGLSNNESYKYEDKKLTITSDKENFCENTYSVEYDEFYRIKKQTVNNKSYACDFYDDLVGYTVEPSYKDEDDINYGAVEKIDFKYGDTSVSENKMQYSNKQLLTTSTTNSKSIINNIKMNYVYDNNNRLTSITYGTDTIYNCVYDEKGRVVYTHNGDYNKRITYLYNETGDVGPIGSIKQIKYANTPLVTVNYNELTKEVESVVNGTTNTVEEYAYDGRILDKITNSQNDKKTFEETLSVNVDKELSSKGYRVYDDEYGYGYNEELLTSDKDQKIVPICQFECDLANNSELSNAVWTLFNKKYIVDSEEKKKEISHYLIGYDDTIIPILHPNYVKNKNDETNEEENKPDISETFAYTIYHMLANLRNQGVNYLYKNPSEPALIYDYNLNRKESSLILRLKVPYKAFSDSEGNAKEVVLFAISGSLPSSSPKLHFRDGYNITLVKEESGIYAKVNSYFNTNTNLPTDNPVFEEQILIDSKSSYDPEHEFLINIKFDIINEFIDNTRKSHIKVRINNSEVKDFYRTNITNMKYLSILNQFDNEQSEYGCIGAVLLKPNGIFTDDFYEFFIDRMNEIESKARESMEVYVAKTFGDNDFDKISFNKTLNSVANLKPYKFYIDDLDDGDSFELVENSINDCVDRYVYTIKNQTLCYKLPLDNSGSVVFKASKDDKKIVEFIHLTNKNDINILLRSDENNALYCKINGSEKNIGTMVAGQYYTFLISWSKIISSGSLPTSNTFINVFVDGVEKDGKYISSSLETTSMEMYLGRKKNSSLTYCGKVGNIYNLLLSENRYLSLNEKMNSNLCEKEMSLCKYDEYNRLESASIYTINNSKIVNIFDYNAYPDDSEVIISNPYFEDIMVDDESLYQYLYIDKDTKLYLLEDIIHDIQYEYIYDGKNQLTNVNTRLWISGAEPKLLSTTSFTYDDNGNIIEKNRSIVEANENDINQMADNYNKTFTYDGIKLTSYGGNSITYDGLFPKVVKNANNETIKTFEWVGSQLTKLTYNQDNVYYNFKYNYKGLREVKEKYVNSLLVYKKWYNYDKDGKLISEKILSYLSDGTVDKTDIILYKYDVFGRYFAMTYNGTPYYYVRNKLGDVLCLVDKNGQVVSKYAYDPYGMVTVLDGVGNKNTSTTFIGNINPIRYKGYYYDVETQLFYCNSRYYSPELCRFISPDSIEYLDPQSINGLNLYCYCMNNPIMYADPSGHFVITLSAVLWAAAIGAAIGAVSGAVYGGITAVANGQNVWTGIGIGALTGGFMGAGAGVASLFIAPVLVGEGVMVATATGAGFVMGNALSAGAALAIGTGIAFGTGFVGGMVADASTQVINDGGVNDWGSVFVSGIQWGLINTAGAFLGSMGGTSTLNGALLSAIFGGVTGAIGMTIDILRNRKNQKQKVSVNNQLYAYCF